MRSFILFLSIFLAVEANKNHSNFILGGIDASIEDFPYMAEIHTIILPTCGGSILTTRNVLTAGHCILMSTTTAVNVLVGSSRRRGRGGNLYRARRITIHPDYVYSTDPFVMQSDVAVITTRNPIRFGALVQPIPLGTDLVPADTRVVLTGWGAVGAVSLNFKKQHL